MVPTGILTPRTLLLRRGSGLKPPALGRLARPPTNPSVARLPPSIPATTIPLPPPSGFSPDALGSPKTAPPVPVPTDTLAMPAWHSPWQGSEEGKPHPGHIRMESACATGVGLVDPKPTPTHGLGGPALGCEVSALRVPTPWWEQGLLPRPWLAVARPVPPRYHRGVRFWSLWERQGADSTPAHLGPLPRLPPAPAPPLLSPNFPVSLSPPLSCLSLFPASP